MDGPFEFRLANAGHTLWRVRCVGRYEEAGAPVAEFLVPGAMLLESVRAAAATALAECERRGWADADVDTLRGALGAVGRPST